MSRPGGRALLMVPLLTLLFQGCIGTDVIEDRTPRIELDREEALMLRVGDTHQLSATYFSKEGERRENVSIVWKSSDEDVVSVTNMGLLRADTIGTADVYSHEEGEPETRSPKVSVEVTTNLQIAIFINNSAAPERLTLIVGEERELDATITSTNGEPLDDERVRWASTDAQIASIDEDGLVMARAAGTAMVAAMVEDMEDIKDMLMLTVNNLPATQPTRIEVAFPMNAQPSLRLGGASGSNMIQLEISAFNSMGDPINNIDITWASDDEDVVSVTEAGLATAHQVGSANITASHGSGSDNVVGMLRINVVNDPDAVAHVSIIVPGSFMPPLRKDATLTLNARATNAGRNPVPSITFTWTSSDEGVLRVNAMGVVTGVDAGMADISATATGTMITSAATSIRVVDPAVPTRMSIAAPHSNPIDVDGMIQLTSTVHNAFDEVITPTLTWVSMMPSVATVNRSGGLVTGVSGGMADIMAMAGNVMSDPVTITVRMPTPSGTRTGAFVESRGGYNLGGTVTVTANSDGSHTLMLGSDFTVRGPDVYVYLHRSSNGTPALELFKLSPCPCNGARTHVIPASTDISEFDFVIIYCRGARIIFGYAQLSN